MAARCLVFSDNAIKVLEKRYFLRNEAGELIESVEGLFERVARAISSAEISFGASAQEVEALRRQFFDLMYKREFLPNSPTLMNAGKPTGQLSACFVLPVPDSLEGIFETCKNAALIHKTGGGTGFSFSRLRPANDHVATSCGVASGPVSFMTVYDAATEAIRQGGTRRGANMGMLRVDHPDIEEFITCKQDTGKLNNFNISVAVTDAFMEALATDSEFDLIHPRTGKSVRRLEAQAIFDLIVDSAHATGEPGIVFIDRINKSDPLSYSVDENGNVVAGTEDIEATNPCGEQPLGPYDACNLGSLNLSRFVDEEKKDIDWVKLGESIALAVRFLDNVIETNCYPLELIKNATLNNRRIGLGVMGWAEALIKMGIAYDSLAALDKARQLMSFFRDKSHQASQELALKRGKFPNWLFSTWAQRERPMRNATVTTIAPTGTISIIAGTSSGIEPLFAISYIRRVMGGMDLIEINPMFEALAKERGFYSEELMERIAEHGTLAGVEGIPDDVKRLWICSHDVSYEWHVRMQAAFQEYTDNAVSKTINFPASASKEDIRNSYMSAWELGLKGITVYRDASRRSQVLNIYKTDPTRNASDSQLPSASCSMARDNGDEKRKKSRSMSLAGTANSLQFEAADFDIDNRHPGDERNLLACDSDFKSVMNSGLSYTGDLKGRCRCPECGSGTTSLARHDACVVCVSCGYTKC